MHSFQKSFNRMKQINEKVIAFGSHDRSTIEQICRCAAAGSYGVLCADGHKGYSQPIGGVVAYQDQVSISGVGYDIACGNMAIRTDASASQVQGSIVGIMRDITRQISFGVGRVNATPVDHELFDAGLWNEKPWKDWKKISADQLGTVGSGNHYVDIFISDDEQVWVGVHFGSRGLGHKTATYFLQQAGGRDGMDVPPTLVDRTSSLGEAYWEGMNLAGKYAYAGREYVARKVVKSILQAKIVQEVHNHHNYCWPELHFGESFYVVRKGATPAFPGQHGFIGGSMGDDAVIIEGVDSEESEKSLYSTIHGAGRVMSRTAAKGKFVRNEAGQKIRQPGLVRRDEMRDWLEKKGVLLVGGDLDEAPQAYRRLPEVLAEHAGTIRILHTLRPIGVAMAGTDVHDPYKD
jgi:tRNA-splicing ligase RtcB (3'-phosphate/5'-hydroxy nucleic acid ligase)